MTKVAANLNVLKWALSRSRKSIPELEAKFPKLMQWLTGQQQPTLRQLEELAKQTATPFGYLFLEKPPTEELPIPYFRTFEKAPPTRISPELLDTIYEMQKRQVWMREYLIQQGHDSLSFVQSVKVDKPVQSVVQCMREILRVDQNWASDLKTWAEALQFLQETMERAGIIVIVNGVVGNNTHRPLDVTEFRGFVLVDEYAPLAFINGADVKAAQMFTLAHELAHICFGSSAAFDLRQIHVADDPIEKKCDQAAAEFLVPSELMAREWQTAKDEDEPFRYLARLFKASEIVVARRALDLDLISKESFLSFYEGYRKRVYLKKADRRPGGDFYATQNMRVGRTFATNVILAVKSDRLLYDEAYHLTGLYGKTFDRYAESLGFIGV
ncbi:ImmA/IrrE family metallo-endopeptidase [Desulfomonile tiedjei]|uniref:Putative Zn peptidase n=1 Tax=Desulfomonile tiedjei (strain ATCC 49306 / DSM 6799 / DCB-1) TaxID=706587 RepID=I4CAF7_DESTA|nr:ImmA/IrrE family metallo-endopeptidase [Desulfomonile tiedjei]AFM26548.1 putative Zn peptidase [Desulfomonile tiedjei DSM 6799]